MQSLHFDFVNEFSPIYDLCEAVDFRSGDLYPILKAPYQLRRALRESTQV